MLRVYSYTVFGVRFTKNNFKKNPTPMRLICINVKFDAKCGYFYVTINEVVIKSSKISVKLYTINMHTHLVGET